MKKQVCKLSFRKFLKGILSNFANGVSQGIYTNASIFVAPPLVWAVLKQKITAYTTALADFNALGKIKKTAYLVAREELIAVLNQLASYVNSVADGDASIILTAGFEPTAASNQKPPLLDKIGSVVAVPSKVAGRVTIVIPSLLDKGVSFYGLILVSGPALTPSNFKNGFFNITASEGQKIIMDFNRKRIKVIDGLDSSIEYTGYVFAINSVGASPLSDAVRVKCI